MHSQQCTGVRTDEEIEAPAGAAGLFSQETRVKTDDTVRRKTDLDAMNAPRRMPEEADFF